MEEEYSFKQYPHLGHVHSHLQALPLKCLLRPFALCLLPIYSLVAVLPYTCEAFFPFTTVVFSLEFIQNLLAFTMHWHCSRL